MADCFCIKIGENQDLSYSKFNKLSKHSDIIDVLPRKRDLQGNLLNRGMGQKAERKYFALWVDCDHINDKDFISFRSFIITPEFEEKENPEEHEPKKNILNKRKYNVNFFNLPGFTAETVNKINDNAKLVRDKLKRNSVDMKTMEKKDKVIPFIAFCQAVNVKGKNISLWDVLPDKFKP